MEAPFIPPRTITAKGAASTPDVAINTDAHPRAATTVASTIAALRLPLFDSIFSSLLLKTSLQAS